MQHLIPQVESLIFAATSPISAEEIRKSLSEAFHAEVSGDDITAAIAQLTERYRQEQYAFEIVAIDGGYRFLTKPAYHNAVGTHLKLQSRKQLSRAALETLSIVAYRQPVTKSEMEQIRGVSCDYSIQKLLEKELITIAGRSDKPGRPLLYATSAKFMDYFGLNRIQDLPQLKEFATPDLTIGEAAPIEEEPPGEGVSDPLTDG